MSENEQPQEQVQVPAPVQELLDTLNRLHAGAASLATMGGPFAFVCVRIREGVEATWKHVNQPPPGAEDAPAEPEAEPVLEPDIAPEADPDDEPAIPDAAPPPPPAATE